VNTVALLGTSHSIQRGEQLFLTLLENTFIGIRYQSIAEEIDRNAIYLAETFCIQNKLTYTCIEPSPEERVELGIASLSNITFQIMNEFEDEHPELSIWPSDANESTLPSDVWNRYSELSDIQHRAREQIWKDRLLELNLWPCLCIIGADHYTPFKQLLVRAGLRVIDIASDWEPSSS
jgi:hypothetical protein